jgi:D-sedoheptulose 7-phosphate isomerase
MPITFIQEYLDEVSNIVKSLDHDSVEKMVDILKQTKEQEGRLFILGVGGSAANASHAVNDFRKIAGLETYAPTDNISELTARTNDEGWETVFASWLKTSKLKKSDSLMVFSVGGGDIEKNVSTNLVKAVEYGKKIGCKILGIVGPRGGYTYQVADACVKIPVQHTSLITPLSESFQAIIWHLIVSHPKLKVFETKWESVSK